MDYIQCQSEACDWKQKGVRGCFSPDVEGRLFGAFQVESLVLIAARDQPITDSSLLAPVFPELSQKIVSHSEFSVFGFLFTRNSPTALSGHNVSSDTLTGTRVPFPTTICVRTVSALRLAPMVPELTWLCQPTQILNKLTWWSAIVQIGKFRLSPSDLYIATSDDCSYKPQVFTNFSFSITFFQSPLFKCREAVVFFVNC